jgi:hypothetical protein
VPFSEEDGSPGELGEAAQRSLEMLLELEAVSEDHMSWAFSQASRLAVEMLNISTASSTLPIATSTAPISPPSNHDLMWGDRPT